jgi:hypothetical protein
MCDHFREPVKIGAFNVLASSLFGQQSDHHTHVTPDYGFYLDSGWAGVKIPYPSELIKWPDGGIIELDEFASLIERIDKKVKLKQVVDIGCIEGHGRTGTVLAGLVMKVEQADAINAIREIRTRYCSGAVETPSQKKLLLEYEAYLRPIT